MSCTTWTDKNNGRIFYPIKHSNELYVSINTVNNFCSITSEYKSKTNLSLYQNELYQKNSDLTGQASRVWCPSDSTPMGRIWRVSSLRSLIKIIVPSMNNASVNSVIVKHVALPDSWTSQLLGNHQIISPAKGALLPGGNGLVPVAFTQQWDERCPVPGWPQCELQENEWLIVMQDLAEIGFPSTSQFDACCFWRSGNQRYSTWTGVWL